MWRPGGGPSRLTWRRLGVLIDRLPPESALKTALRDAQGAMALAEQAKQGNQGDTDTGYGSYSNTDMHLGALIDEVRWLAYAIYHSQGAKPKKPKQYPRPGVMPERARNLSPRAREYLGSLRLRRAALNPESAAPSGLHVPDHIADAPHKRLGPAERQWIADQLQQMRARATPPAPHP